MLTVILAAVVYLSLIYVCGRYTAQFAAERGRSWTAWFIIGGLLYPLPYLVLAFLPPHRKQAPAG